jgi:hypothetical protein
MILLGLLVLIYSSILFWILAPTGSLRICILSIPNVLQDVAFDILDLYSFLPDVFLGLGPEHFATLRMFCSPSSGDWKLSSHPSTRS